MIATNSSIPIIAALVIFLLIVIVLAGFIYQLYKRTMLFQHQIDCSQLMLDEINSLLKNQQVLDEKEKKQLEQWQLEHQQVSQQLEHRIKMVQTQLTEQQQLIEQNHSQMPEDKLYSRAQKMVLLGADVDELIVECDLPKAEAEMLVALHNKKPV